jgi:predicted kinase
MSAARLECVILVGLPAAGKTSFYRKQFAATHLHVSKDLWPNASKKEERQRTLITASLEANRSVVIDNTNPRRSDREPLIAIAHAYNAKVIGYYFDVATRVAVARNAERSGKAKVPNVAIFTAAKKIELPSYDEGFDTLWRVVVNEERQLETLPF